MAIPVGNRKKLIEAWERGKTLLFEFGPYSDPPGKELSEGDRKSDYKLPIDLERSTQIGERWGDIGQVVDSIEELSDGRFLVVAMLRVDQVEESPVGYQCPECNVWHVGFVPLRYGKDPSAVDYICRRTRHVIGSRDTWSKVTRPRASLS